MITTDVLTDRDYTEWHGGIPCYGFWCVQIEDRAWLDRLDGVCLAFEPDLQTGYQRFTHITIATVGLMHDENRQLVERQIAHLHRLALSPIELHWESIGSYTHSPIVRVSSTQQPLLKIRQALHTISVGDDSADYDPHITLGCYDKVTSVSQSQLTERAFVADTLQPLEISKLLFCTYQTQSIKGPITVEFEIDLGGKSVGKP